MAFTTGSWSLDVISVLVTVLSLLIAYTRWQQFFWQRRGVYAKPPQWIIGNARDLLLQKHCQGVEFQKVYEDFKSKGLRFGGYYVFSKPLFVVIDLDLIKSILVKDFAHFNDHGTYSDPDADELSGHLFDVAGQEWRFMRTKLTPTFTSGKMKMMFPLLVKCAADLREHVDELIDAATPIDIKDIAARFTTDIIMSSAFGLEGNCLRNPDAEYRKYGMMFFQKGFSDAMLRFLVVLWPEVLYFFRISGIRKEINRFFCRLATETVAYREQNNIVRKDFMHLLIQLKNNVKIDDNDVGSIINADGTTKGSDGITMRQLIGQAWVFFFAGFETSSSTATFCLYELVHHPGYQEKVREEINTVVERFNGEITYEALQQMTYMDKCIQETLRLYPVLPFLPRKCTIDYQIPGTQIVIPKGCQVFVPLMGIQRDPEYYPDPLVYDPERFAPENVAKRPAGTWSSFGDGPRLCIGMRFGLMQTKLTLAVLLRNYKLTFHPKTEVPLRLEPSVILLSTKGDVCLNAEKIQ